MTSLYNSAGRHHLRLVRGGLSDTNPPPPPDWRDFCTNIGWQQPAEPILPADYEDRLAAQIFGGVDGSGAGIADAAEEAAQLDLSWWATLAVAAIIGIACAAMLTWQTHPAAAKHLPTPVRDRPVLEAAPEHPIVPVKPLPVDRKATIVSPKKDAVPQPLEPPTRTAPDPGGMLAKHVYVWTAISPPRSAYGHGAPELTDDEGAAHRDVVDPGAIDESNAPRLAVIDPDGNGQRDAVGSITVASLSPQMLPAATAHDDEAFALDGPVVVAAADDAMARTPWRAANGWYGFGMSAPREVTGVPAGVRLMAAIDLAAAGRHVF